MSPTKTWRPPPGGWLPRCDVRRCIAEGVPCCRSHSCMAPHRPERRPPDLQLMSAADLLKPEARELAAIYESSFGQEEREPTRTLLSNMAAENRSCYIAKSNGHVAAFAVVRALPCSVGFLEYFAVADDLRAQGIGGSLLPYVLREVRAAASDGLIFEVDDPDGSEGHEEWIRLARIRFYRRHGADVVRCAPSYQAPSSNSLTRIHYLLMWIPLARGLTELSGEMLRMCVREMLVFGYGLTDGDPLVGNVLQGLKC